MKVAFFSTKPYDQQSFRAANAAYQHELVFFEARLTSDTAGLAAGFGAVCAFVNDQLDAPVLRQLAADGVRTIALRSAGFNHVDLPVAQELGLTVVRVPAYSPYAVAEHTIGMILALNRKIHRAYNRVREGNFALEGLLGFDLHGRTAGVVGTGRIGAVVTRILHGFGCELLVHDPYPNADVVAIGARYVELPELYRRSDLITLHCPLTPQTRHLINAVALEQMRPGVMLINTSRGGLIDTPAVVDALKAGTIGYLGLDVYEEETGLFFEDKSGSVIQDDVFSRLLTFPNVLVTGHQAFFTRQALVAIADTTLRNIRDIETTGASPNVVTAD
jgi:D-lactate dehydrogenase